MISIRDKNNDRSIRPFFDSSISDMTKTKRIRFKGMRIQNITFTRRPECIWNNNINNTQVNRIV